MAQIRQTGGKPTLYIDEKITAPVLYALSDFPGAASNTAYAQRNIPAFARAGVRLVAADTGLHLGWRKATGFDPDALICELSSVLDANPDAKIFLRLHMNPPYWWLRDHPEECIVYAAPEGDHPGIDNGESDRLIRDDAALHMRVSLASRRWVEEAAQRMVWFLEALKGTPEGDALVGLQVACGLYGEWAQWGWDVGQPAQQRFRRWLRETYGTEEALRKAWNDPQVTFETARFAPRPWIEGDDGAWRDPQTSQYVIDSFRVQQLAAPEAILHFCRAAKAVCPQLLCGAFYGYYLGSGTVMPNHLFPEMMFQDPAISFLSGPFCYFPMARVSEGATIQRALLESQRLNGMLWLTEMDQHPSGLEYCEGGDPERFDERIATLRRCTLQTLLAGEGFWYYDHRIVPLVSGLEGVKVNESAVSIYRKRGWWEPEESMREIAAIQRLAQDIASRPYRSAADVVLVYDTESCFYQTDNAAETVRLHHGLTRAGVVFDSIYLMDLPKYDLQRCKCIIFVNCHMLTPQKRSMCRRLAQGRMAIYLHGQGYCDGKSLSAAHLSETVGMKMRKTEAKSVIVGEEVIPLPPLLSPQFAVEDEQAEVLARYDNGSAAAAIRGNDVYIHLQHLPKPLLKDLLGRAGVHFWCDSDEPVLAGAGLAAVNCQRAGKRTLTLPNGKQITIETDGYATPVYSIETGERVL